MPFVRIAQSLRRHSLPESVEIAAIGVRLSHHLDGQKKSAYGFGSLGDNPPGLDELEIPFTVTMLPQHGGLVPGGSVIITVNVPPEYFGRVSATLVAVTEVSAEEAGPRTISVNNPLVKSAGRRSWTSGIRKRLSIGTRPLL